MKSPSCLILNNTAHIKIHKIHTMYACASNITNNIKLAVIFIPKLLLLKIEDVIKIRHVFLNDNSFFTIDLEYEGDLI